MKQINSFSCIDFPIMFREKYRDFGSFLTVCSQRTSSLKPLFHFARRTTRTTRWPTAPEQPRPSLADQKLEWPSSESIRHQVRMINKKLAQFISKHNQLLLYKTYKLLANLTNTTGFELTTLSLTRTFLYPLDQLITL